MSRWTAHLILLFLLVWVLLGVWIWFGGSPANVLIGMANLAVPAPLISDEPSTFAQLRAAYPEPIAVFLYTFEKRILVYIGLVFAATLMLIFFVRRAVKLIRQPGGLRMQDPVPAQFPMPGWQQRLIVVFSVFRNRFSFSKLSGRGFGWDTAMKPAAMIFLTGLLMIGIVYDWMVDALRKQSDDRAFAVATKVIDWAATHKVRKNDPALRSMLASYAASPQVAYIFIEDGAGDVLAHSLPSFPAELRNSSFGAEPRQTTTSALDFNGERVVATRIPVPESPIGAVHVAVWAAARDEEIRRAVLPLIAVMFVMVLIGAIVSAWLTLKLNRPIIRLARAAERLSKGDLDTPISAASRDEIGDLALSLERMRSSLKASIELLYRLRSKENQPKRKISA